MASLPTLNLSAVNLSSNNTVNSLAKEGDVVTLTFTSSESLLNTLTVTFTGATNSASITNVGNDYTVIYTVDSSDTEGALSFTIDNIENTTGITIDSITDTTDGSSVTIDTTAPSVGTSTSITTPSNNTTPSFIFTSNDSGTLTSSLGFSTSSSVSSGENTVTFNTLSEGTYTGATITVTDAAGNSSDLTIPEFVIDTTAPTLSSVTISSNNDNDTSLAKEGDVVTLTFTSSETLLNVPTVTFTGATNSANVSNDGNDYTVNYTVASGDTEGTLSFSISDLVDTAGNTGNAVSSTDDSSSVSIDTTAPIVNTFTMSDTALKIGDTSTVTLEFSEAVTGFSSDDDITVSNGTLSLMTSTDSGITWTGTYTPDADVEDTTNVLTLATTYTDTAGNAGPSNDSANYTIDTLAPTISSVTSSTTTGYFKENDTISLTVTFSEAVTLSGDNLVLNLNTGETVTILPSDLSSADSVTKTYTVSAGVNVANLNVNTITLNVGGTLSDDAGNNMTVFTGYTDLGNGYVIDTTAPTISTVTTSTVSEYYKDGESIDIVVTFSESIVADSNCDLSLILDIDSGDVTLVTPTFGDTTATFTYVVSSSDDTGSNILNYASTAALSITAGTLTDLAGNSPTLTLPSLSDNGLYNTGIYIDNTAPTVTSVDTTTSSGYYNSTNSDIEITVTFSETVVVTGTPSLELAMDGTNASASYISGNNTNALTFNYDIGSSDDTSRLDYSSTSALSGTITDLAGNTATLTLPALQSSEDNLYDKNIVIDNTPPEISSITTTSTSGSYGIGSSLIIKVLFTERVSKSGSPVLSLSNGATITTSTYDNTNTTEDTLVFTYDVAEGDTTSGSTLNATSLTGTITDQTLNSADVSNITVAWNNDITIDAVKPTVTSVSTTTSTGYYNNGDADIPISITFSEAVVVTGTPTLDLEMDGTNATLNYVSGDGTNTLLFNYTIGASDDTSQLDYSSTSALSGTITDTVSNNPNSATLTLPDIATSDLYETNIVIDNTQPTVSGVDSTATRDNYTIEDGNQYFNDTTGENVIPIQITFDETVVVTGTPTLELTMDGTNASATYDSGSNSSILTFNYTVGSSDNTSQLDYSSTSALDLNSGTINDLAGNTATLTLPNAVGTSNLFNKNIVIDTTEPTIGTITSTTDDGSYKAGDSIAITVQLTESVVVTGTPELSLTSGGTAYYTSGTGSDTLIFTYTIGSGENTISNNSIDYLDVNTNGLTLPSGSLIQDYATNDATLTFSTGTVLDGKSIVIDTTAPSSFTTGTVTAVGGTVDANFYNATNTGIQVTVPVDDDVSLHGGIIKLIYSNDNKVSYIEDNFSSYDHEITSGDRTNGFITFNISDTDFEATINESVHIYFSAIITDKAGNSTVGNYTDTDILRYDLPPATVKVGLVTASSGRVVTNYYNSTNNGLIITVPIPNDNTLVRPPNLITTDDATTITQGTVQVLVSVDNGSTYNEIGSLNEITQVDINSNKLITITDEEFIGAVNEGETAMFNVTIIDEDDNVTTTDPQPDGVTPTQKPDGSIDYNQASDNTITRIETSPSLPNVTFTKGSNKRDINNKVIIKFGDDVTNWDYSVNSGKEYTTFTNNNDVIIYLKNGVYKPGSIIIRNYNVAGDRSSVLNSVNIIISSSKQGYPLPNKSSSMNIGKRKGYAFSRAAF